MLYEGKKGAKLDNRGTLRRKGERDERSQKWGGIKIPTDRGSVELDVYLFILSNNR